MAAASGRRIEVENPSRREPLASVAARRRGGRRPRGRAPRRRRSRRGAACPARDRGLLLTRIADDLAGIGEELARIIAAETGNAIRTQARGEAATAADVFRYFGGVAGEQKGEVLPLGDGMLSYSVREPLGVVAAIVPWNAPVLLASLKVAMALCTGNTLVLKAAEDAPLGVLRTGRGLRAAPARRRAQRRHGLRRGVRRRAAQPPRHREDLLHRARPRSAGSRCAPRPSASCRCRSSSAARRRRSSTPTPTTTPPWRTSSRAMRFARQGQSCTAGSRLYVHQSIFDDFTARLVERSASWSSATRSTSARTSARSCPAPRTSRVCGYVREALDQGATAVAGGLPDDGRPGYQLRPTVLTGVEQSWRVAREEVFGPVLVALPWSDEDEVIALGQRHPLRPRGVRVLQGPRRAPCAPRTGSRPAGSRSTAAAASCRA